MLAPAEALMLDRLTFGGAASALPATTGVRRARASGTGVEFHEYRRYQPGDDPRSIDWTVEARLRQLVVRVSRADGHLRLHVLIDTSASMSVGNPTNALMTATSPWFTTSIGTISTRTRNGFNRYAP